MVNLFVRSSRRCLPETNTRSVGHCLFINNTYNFVQRDGVIGGGVVIDGVTMLAMVMVVVVMAVVLTVTSAVRAIWT